MQFRGSAEANEDRADLMLGSLPLEYMRSLCILLDILADFIAG